MATSRPFAYNSSLSPISGAIQVVNSPLAIGVSDQDYTLQPGGIQWWEGPDEELGYVIAHSVPTGTQPNPLGIPSYVGFWRSSDLSESSFVQKAGYVTDKTYNSGDEAYIWLSGFEHWSSWPISNGSISFPPSGNLTTIDPQNMLLNNTFTIEFWYYGTPGAADDQIIFYQGGGSFAGDLILYISTSDKCLHGLSTGDAISGQLPTDNWVHVAIVCNGGTITVYFNGVDVTANGIPPCNIANDVDPIYFGSRNGTAKFLKGLLTDIRIVKSVVYNSQGFQVPTSPLLPIQDDNPYGGSSTVEIVDGDCVLLIGALSSTDFYKDLSNIGSTVTNSGLSFDSGTPY